MSDKIISEVSGKEINEGDEVVTKIIPPEEEGGDNIEKVLLFSDLDVDEQKEYREAGKVFNYSYENKED